MSDPKRSDYTGKKPSSADRVSDRLIEARDRIEALERALLDANDRLEHLDAQLHTVRRERDSYWERYRLAQKALNRIITTGNDYRTEDRRRFILDA